MSKDLLQYPDEFEWANKFTYYLATRITPKDVFRTGDWLKFLVIEDLAQLTEACATFNTLTKSEQQDLMLLVGLLFSREMQKVGMTLDARFAHQILIQLSKILNLEGVSRDGLIFIEHRQSIRPGHKTEYTLRSDGIAFVEKYGELPFRAHS